MLVVHLVATPLLMCCQLLHCPSFAFTHFLAEPLFTKRHALICPQEIHPLFSFSIVREKFFETLRCWFCSDTSIGLMKYSSAQPVCVFWDVSGDSFGVKMFDLLGPNRSRCILGQMREWQLAKEAFSPSCDWRIPGLFGQILCKCVQQTKFSTT